MERRKAGRSQVSSPVHGGASKGLSCGSVAQESEPPLLENSQHPEHPSDDASLMRCPLPPPPVTHFLLYWGSCCRSIGHGPADPWASDFCSPPDPRPGPVAPSCRAPGAAWGAHTQLATPPPQLAASPDPVQAWWGGSDTGAPPRSRPQPVVAPGRRLKAQLCARGRC